MNLCKLTQHKSKMDNFVEEGYDGKTWFKNYNVKRPGGLPPVISERKLSWYCSGRNIFDPYTDDWRVVGKLHRDDDLPAIIFININRHRTWYENGKFIRQVWYE
jgi:hypothetical protein